MNHLSGRRSSKLSNSTLQSLSTYALAASAAGVGVLALTSAAEAKIVYTPAHVVLGPSGPFSYNLDLNHDGITDAVLEKTSSCDTDRCFWYLAAFGQNSAALAVGQPGLGLALPAAAVIGPKRQFANGFVDLAGYFSHSSSRKNVGNWVNVKNRYLGVQFQINGQTHYGWARLSVTVNGSAITGTLTGYAYETVANQPIIAGKTASAAVIALRESDIATPPQQEPASLGLLAQGAAGLQAWRREDV